MSSRGRASGGSAERCQESVQRLSVCRLMVDAVEARVQVLYSGATHLGWNPSCIRRASIQPKGSTRKRGRHVHIVDDFLRCAVAKAKCWARTRAGLLLDLRARTCQAAVSSACARHVLSLWTPHKTLHIRTQGFLKTKWHLRSTFPCSQLPDATTLIMPEGVYNYHWPAADRLAVYRSHALFNLKTIDGTVSSTWL
jgi:hypothetical protein